MYIVLYVYCVVCMQHKTVSALGYWQSITARATVEWEESDFDKIKPCG